MVQTIREIKKLCIEGLLTDGAHHKQWYLEEILKRLGFNLNQIRKELRKEDYDWEDGLAP